MTYEECIEYLYAQLPMFQREGASALKKDLSNIKRLCEELGRPQDSFKIIHVAGTNGKGSVSHMLSSILQAADLKVGLYTSPHYVDFRERIKINGLYIGEAEVVSFVEVVTPFIQEIKPSFFEITVAMAFHHFREQGVDWAVIETGLGGRLDSTNVVSPQLCVITNISYDHQQFLGDTLEDIAGEKAGIIKEGVPVVIGRYQSSIHHVFTDRAAQLSAPLYRATDVVKIEEVIAAGDGFAMKVHLPHLKKRFEVQIGLRGDFQIENGLTVLAAIQVLRDLGLNISLDDIRRGLGYVKELAGMRGRWEILKKSPRVIADSGHNEDGIRRNMKELEHYEIQELRMVIGMVRDKDVEKILSLLPKHATYYWCAADIPRALSAAELSGIAATMGLRGDFYNSVEVAIRQALKEADDSDLIYIGGSTFIVAEALDLAL